MKHDKDTSGDNGGDGGGGGSQTMGVSFGALPTMEEGDERSSFSSSNVQSETSSVRDRDVRDVPSAYAAELEAAAASFVGMGGKSEGGAGADADADADADAAAVYGGGMDDGSATGVAIANSAYASSGSLFQKVEAASHEQSFPTSSGQGRRASGQPLAGGGGGSSSGGAGRASASASASASAAAAAAASTADTDTPYTSSNSLERMSLSRSALVKERGSSVAMHASEITTNSNSNSPFFGSVGGSLDGSEDGDVFGNDGLGSAIPKTLDSMSRGLAGMFGGAVPDDDDAAAADEVTAAAATAAASPRLGGIGMHRKPSTAGGGTAGMGPKKSQRQSSTVQLGFGRIKPGAKRNTISER